MIGYDNYNVGAICHQAKQTREEKLFLIYKALKSKFCWLA